MGQFLCVWEFIDILELHDSMFQAPHLPMMSLQLPILFPNQRGDPKLILLTLRLRGGDMGLV